MISASNIFNDLATALRRTMSPVRKKDANAAAAGEGADDQGSSPSQSVTMVEGGDVECKENLELLEREQSSASASVDCKTKKTAKKRARFEPLPPLQPPAAGAAADAPLTLSDSDRRSSGAKSLRQRRRQSLAVGMEGGGNRDLARTHSGGHSSSSSSANKRSNRAVQYKRRQSMAASCTVAAAAAAASSSSTSPHFHPDLTLEKLREMQSFAQQKKQASIEAASLTPMQSLDFNDAQFLEINTMFDFHPMPGTSPSPKSAAAAAMAVVAAAETTSKERPSRPRLRSGGDEQEDKADQSSKVREQSGN